MARRVVPEKLLFKAVKALQIFVVLSHKRVKARAVRIWCLFPGMEQALAGNFVVENGFLERPSAAEIPIRRGCHVGERMARESAGPVLCFEFGPQG